ncbi:hypothetical protein GCM10023208_15870 [Erythrobacter westpacificensis]|uniref:Uncharacterized protein n=1 Tax=Erythrobacter westpacificensis TaxID=1055231 RepID=A0ABP9K8S7_9SPHN
MATMPAVRTSRLGIEPKTSAATPAMMMREVMLGPPTNHMAISARLGISTHQNTHLAGKLSRSSIRVRIHRSTSDRGACHARVNFVLTGMPGAAERTRARADQASQSIPAAPLSFRQ